MRRTGASSSTTRTCSLISVRIADPTRRPESLPAPASWRPTRPIPPRSSARRAGAPAGSAPRSAADRGPSLARGPRARAASSPTPTLTGPGARAWRAALLGRGPTLDLDATVNTAEPSLPAVSGLLTPSPPGVTVSQPRSSYPDMTFGEAGTNATPFQATLDSSVACGTTLGFSLQVSADQGSQPVPFIVPTGIGGPATSYDAVDVPKPIPDGGNISSNLVVTGAG